MSNKPAPFRKPTILIVEDDELVRETAHNVISEMGYAVLQSNNGEHASQLLASQPKVDVLFTDIFLDGDMNGLSLANHATEVRPNIAVLLTSGFPPAALRAHGVELNGFAFIQKPYSVKTILALIEEILQSK